MPLLMMAETTTDKVVVTADGDLQPGGDEVKVTSSLEGSRLYTGYEIDIIIPDGITVLWGENEEDYCVIDYSMHSKKHTITSNFLTIDGKPTLRIACIYTGSTSSSLRGTSGDLLTFKLKATLFAKPGPIVLGLENTKFGVFDNSTMQTTGYTPTQTTIAGLTIGNNATAQLSVSADTPWRTLMRPLTTTLPADVKAYSCPKANDESLILTPATEVKAFTPYIIYSDNGYSGTVSGTIPDYPQTDILTSGYLNAAVTPQTLTAGYVLQKHDSGVQFYAIDPNAPVTVQPGKCWVELPQTQASKPSFGFVINNSTGITEQSAQSAAGAYHTLSGIKVSTPQPGTIYIHNGKKVIR